MSTGPDPLDAKYAPGAEQARQNVMVGVSVVMTSLGGKALRSCRVAGYQLTSQVTCVILRVYTRGCIVKNMGREDWTMVAAAVCSIEIFTIDITDQPLDIDHRLLTGADCRSCRVQTWLWWYAPHASRNGQQYQGDLFLLDFRYHTGLTYTAHPRCHCRLQNDRNAHQTLYSYDVSQAR
jgi:hypothetical protein